MGQQANFIITYYSELNDEIEQLKMIMGLPSDQYTDIDSMGNRAFGSEDVQVEILSMKNWGKDECDYFIDNVLSKIKWSRPNTVVALYIPVGEPCYNIWINEFHAGGYIDIKPKVLTEVFAEIARLGQVSGE